MKTAPVVKKSGNAEKLWKSIKDRKLSFVASDHAPSQPEYKNTDSVWKDYSGISGTGILLPYLFSEGFMKKRIDFKIFLEISSENAAKRYGLFDRKGSIEIGKDADLVLWSNNPLSIYTQVEQTYIDGIKYYDVAENVKKQDEIVAERNRLIQKMLKAKKDGAPTQKPSVEKKNLYHCDTVGE